MLSSVHILLPRCSVFSSQTIILGDLKEKNINSPLSGDPMKMDFEEFVFSLYHFDSLKKTFTVVISLLLVMQRDCSPSKIFFYCSEISPEGGETSIVASDVVVEKMEERMPEVMAKVAEVGLIHVFKIFNDDTAKGVHNKRWQSFLGTDDEVEAHKRAIEKLSCSTTQFFSDGRAEFIFGPLNPVVERDEKRAWIIGLNGFNDNADLVSNKFGDGNDFPSEVGDIYRRILEENCVDIKWQKGDVLLLNNFAVQHARRPGKPPRRVLVSMCQ